MKTTNPKILLCDTDINLSAVLADHLQGHGMDVDTVTEGQEALEKLLRNGYDLCILELAMPDLPGLELLQSLQKAGVHTPVMVLTSRSAREDQVRAFQLGCDDYVTKPFSMDLVQLRVSAILRRTSPRSEDMPLIFDLNGHTFDSVRQYIDDRHLSGRENDLLQLLCQHEGQVVERQNILRTVWRKADTFSSRSLSVYVNHLRHALDGTNYRIIGVHGKGYKLVKG